MKEDQINNLLGKRKQLKTKSEKGKIKVFLVSATLTQSYKSGTKFQFKRDKKQKKISKKQKLLLRVGTEEQKKKIQEKLKSEQENRKLDGFNIKIETLL